MRSRDAMLMSMANRALADTEIQHIHSDRLSFLLTKSFYSLHTLSSHASPDLTSFIRIGHELKSTSCILPSRSQKLPVPKASANHRKASRSLIFQAKILPFPDPDEPFHLCHFLASYRLFSAAFHASGAFTFPLPAR